MSVRGVAQSGSAPGLGPGGRRFESCRPDDKVRSFLVADFFVFICRMCYFSLASSSCRLGPGGRRFESCRPDDKVRSFLVADFMFYI